MPEIITDYTTKDIHRHACAGYPEREEIGLIGNTRSQSRIGS